MNAVEMLKVQHAEIESLFRKLMAETHAVDRAELIGRLIDRLTLHAALEDEIFYLAVADLPRGEDLVQHARDEHRQVDRLLEEIRRTRFGAASTIATLSTLRRTVEHHMAEEELTMFPLAERLGAAMLQNLGEHMSHRIDAGRVCELRAVG